MRACVQHSATREGIVTGCALARIGQAKSAEREATPGGEVVIEKEPVRAARKRSKTRPSSPRKRTVKRAAVKQDLTE